MTIEKSVPEVVQDSKVSSGYSNWKSQLETYKNGRVKQTIDNCLLAFRYAPKLTGILKYNIFTGKTEVHNPKWVQYMPTMTDLDLDYIKLELEQAGLTSEKAILSGVNIVAHENAYHPIRDVITGLEWDGKDYLSNLFPKYLGAERSEYTTLITKILFGGIIGRTFTPGMKFDTCVVLQDTQQGGGKSTMCRLLAIRDQWFTTLKSVDDPDKVVEQITGHLIIELEEMESIATAKSIETVRSFLSRSSDTYRTPYAKFSQDIRRGSVCVGTSNDPSFLPMDRAGNRRFLPLKCDKTKAEQHPLDDENQTRADIMGAYAQAMQLYREGNLPFTLPKEWEKRLPDIQKDFLPEDTKAGVIEQWLTGGEDGSNQDYICVPMIYQKALNNAGLPKQWESKEIAAILDGLVDDQGNKLLKRYEKSGGIRRFNQKGFTYGRQKAWTRASEQKRASEQFMPIPENLEADIPFID